MGFEPPAAKPTADPAQGERRPSMRESAEPRAQQASARPISPESAEAQQDRREMAELEARAGSLVPAARARLDVLQAKRDADLDQRMQRAEVLGHRTEQLLNKLQERHGTVPAPRVQRTFTYNKEVYEQGHHSNTRDLCKDPDLKQYEKGVKLLAGKPCKMEFETKEELITYARQEQAVGGGMLIVQGGRLGALMVSDLPDFKGRVFGLTCAHVLPTGSKGGMKVVASGHPNRQDIPKSPIDWSLLEAEKDDLPFKAGVLSRADWKDKTKAGHPPLTPRHENFQTGKPLSLAVGMTVQLLGPHGLREFKVVEKGVENGPYWGLIPSDVGDGLMKAESTSAWDKIVDNATSSGTSGSCYFAKRPDGGQDPIGMHVGKTQKYKGLEDFPLVKKVREENPGSLPRIIQIAAITEVLEQINKSKFAREQPFAKRGDEEAVDLQLRFATARDKLRS